MTKTFFSYIFFLWFIFVNKILLYVFILNKCYYMMVWWYKCSVIQLLKAYRTHNWSGLYIFRQILLLPIFLFSIHDHNQNWIIHDKFTFFLVCLMFVPPFFDKWNYNAVYLYMRMLGVCEWKSSNTSLLWETLEFVILEIMAPFCRQFVQCE